MSRVLKITESDGIYFVTFTTVQWIDLFTRREYKNILVESLRYCQEHKGLLIHAFVFMTNHLHLIISRTPDGAELSDIIRDFKKFTSRRLVQAVKELPESRREWLLWLFSRAGEHNPNNTQYQVWQQDSHPVELRTLKFIRQKLNYIHDNPVKEGIVFSSAEYVYSSASVYFGLPQECPLEVVPLDFQDGFLSP